MLNKHFHTQSVLDHQLSIQNCSKIGTVHSASEVVKMIKDLNTGKASGADDLRKADLSIDIKQIAACLSGLF